MILKFILMNKTVIVSHIQLVILQFQKYLLWFEEI